jgi:trigger factor
VGDDVVFELTYPAQEKVNPELANRTVRFYVTVKKIETMTLPALNDDFAARFTDRFAVKKTEELGLEVPEQQPLSLLELRMRIRELLQADANRVTLDSYADKVLEEIVKGAEISYPEVMVEDQIESLLQNVDDRLKSQGLSLETFQQITGKSRQDLQNDYRQQAIENLNRSLVLAELLTQERVTVSQDDLRKEVDAIAAQFGDQAEAILRSLNTPQMRTSIVNRLLQEKAFERIAAIGRGQAPELEAVTEDAEATQPEPGEAVQPTGEGQSS